MGSVDCSENSQHSFTETTSPCLRVILGAWVDAGRMVAFVG